MTSSDFRVGVWLVRPALNLVTDGRTTVHLEPKTMDVLRVLAEHAGQVVTKDELLARVWPGVFIADSGVFRVISELRRLFDDAPRSPRYIQTIPKRGYRLIAPVAEVASADASIAMAEPTPRSTPFASIGAVVTVAVVMAIGLFLLGRQAHPAAAPRVVAAPEAFAIGQVWEDRADCGAYARARQSYEEALAARPDYPDVYGNLTDSYLASAVIGCLPPAEARARIAALTGLDRGWPSAQERVRREAAAAFWLAGDDARAGRDFASAPGVPDVNRAAYLLATGALDRAATEARLAWQRDPAALGENWTLATVWLFEGRDADARRQYEHTLSIYPDFPPAVSLLALTDWLSGDVEAAHATALRAERLLRAPLDRFSAIPALVLADLGDTTARDRYLDRWTEAARHSGWVAPTARATVALARGDTAGALAALDAAAASRDPWLAVARLDPVFRNLRTVPELAHR
jgi:transcriptional activator of cad operon